jgi:sulfatase maturation enzyme AslB (radical SAM superfamily)
MTSSIIQGGRKWVLECIKMIYSLVKSTIQHFNPGLISRTLREVRLGAAISLTLNYVAQEYSIYKQNKDNRISPTLIQLELTTYCPWRCKGCYMPVEERKDKKVIDLETAHKAVQKGISWGIRNFNLIGGETISRDTVPVIESLITEYPSLSFHCCTNGIYLSSQNEELDDIVLRNNLNIGLSIDGFKETNDAIRGKNSYRSVISAAEYLSSRRSLYGATVTLGPENIEEVTSEEFMDFLISHRFHYVTYGISHKVDHASCSNALEALKSLRKKPIFIYINSLGHIDDLSPLKRDRLISVDKRGKILNDRGERIPIADLDTDIEDIVSSKDWKKRFTLEWALHSNKESN